MKKLSVILSLLGTISCCSSLSNSEFIAQKAYEQGCIDRSSGNPIDNYNCTMKSLRFKTYLHKEWTNEQ